MVVIVLYDVSSALPAPLPLMRINGGEWIVVRRGDEGIAPCDRRRNLFSVPVSGSGAATDIANFAMSFVGYSYVWGGTSPSTGFDCSGLM